MANVPSVAGVIGAQQLNPSVYRALEQYFAGPVERGSISTWKVAGKDVEYARDEPKAKILTPV